jgi:uncharacterized membrane protein YeaQ/YmgE (transglycosylase-associated protein family)
MVGHLVAWIVVGLIAGSLAGRVVTGGGFGFVGDVIVGILGAFVGGFVLHAIVGGYTARGYVGEIIVAFLGACLLLALLRAAGRGTHGGTGRTAATHR